jgi:hypothetical protein
VKQWLQNQYPKLHEEQRPLECTQNAGDLIFVPELFGHATYNEQESVGVGVEFSSIGTSMHAVMRTEDRASYVPGREMHQLKVRQPSAGKGGKGGKGGEGGKGSGGFRGDELDGDDDDEDEE